MFRKTLGALVVAAGVVGLMQWQGTDRLDTQQYLNNPAPVCLESSDNISLTPLDCLIYGIEESWNHVTSSFPTPEMISNSEIIEDIVNAYTPRTKSQVGDFDYGTFTYNLRILKSRGYFEGEFDRRITNQAYTLFNFLTVYFRIDPKRDPEVDPIRFFEDVNLAMPAYLHLASMDFLEKKTRFGPEILIRDPVETASEAFRIVHDTWLSTWQTGEAPVSSPIRSAFGTILPSPLYPPWIKSPVLSTVYPYSNRQVRF